MNKNCANAHDCAEDFVTRFSCQADTFSLIQKQAEECDLVGFTEMNLLGVSSLQLSTPGQQSVLGNEVRRPAGAHMIT